MKTTITFLFLLFAVETTLANLKYHPVSFVISTDKESYYEGEKITFNITITNTDKEHSYPVILPHTQNTGQKLFYLNMYDKANNTLLLRYTENRMLSMMVHDTGTVQIRYLKPQEQIVVPVYLNDFDNYFSYHTQNTSHHSVGVPVFAGVYKVNITYNPKGIPLGDSIYSYYGDFDKDISSGGKLAMHENGVISQLIDLRIKRSSDTVVSIERQKYFVKTDGYMYYYFNEYVEKITTDTRCVHITTLPKDSCSLPKGEYFYNHFTDLYAEYIVRFPDGDIREYRRFSDYCPDYFYTEAYNEFKQKTLYALQLPDKRFYMVSYNQPGGSKHQESYCSSDGTLCVVTTFKYNKKGEFVRTEVEQTQPCIEVEINGKKRSSKRASILEGQ
ncbi:MAG: hypothetical protein V4613_13845 [Bacteroidota bacterium]